MKLWHFCLFFTLACENIFIKTHSTEGKCVIGLENILFAGICASYSQEVLQAGTVKGLKAQLWRGHPQLMFPKKEMQGRTCQNLHRYVLGKINSC